jgi:hypothetical protein
MMEEKDGTGDGECGNEIWVMGTPMDGGSGGGSTTPEVGIAAPEAGGAAWGGGADDTSEMTGVDAGSAGMPP